MVNEHMVPYQQNTLWSMNTVSLPLNGSAKAAVCRVILEHIDHVVEVYEGIVDSHHLDSHLYSCSERQPTDPAKPVDTDTGLPCPGKVVKFIQ